MPKASKARFSKEPKKMTTFKNMSGKYVSMEKEVSESERKVLVRRKYLKNISEMLQMPLIEQKELFILVKNFFSEYLKLEYEFTYEELSNELNKIYIKQTLKNDIDNFLYDLSEAQYFTDKDLEHQDIVEYIQKLRVIIEGLILEEKEAEKQKPSILERIFKKSSSQKSVTEKPQDPEMIREKSLENISIKSDGLPELPTVEGLQNVARENDAYKSSMFEDNGEDMDAVQGMNIISDIPDLPKISPRPLNDVPVQPKQSIPKEFSKKTTLPPKVLPQAKEKKEENILVKKGYALLVEDNNPDIVAIREYMEEAYSALFNNKLMKSKEAYLKALDIYHKLEFHDKEKTYQALYELFKELKPK